MQKYVDVRFDTSIGPIKPMHAVNNGPKVSGSSQQKGNFESYKALKIPYARNHDANKCSAYGGPHTVDVHSVFPNFDADENDPASYDFPCTDKYTQEIFAAGTEVFYRLGESIEHTIKKYYVHPPKDFEKWARICEHIIAHYTEGWADGFRYPIEYWEIWNEPDLSSGSTWTGSVEQFYDLYEATAKHLKQRFPHLKIGGPALASHEDWAEAFLKEMYIRNVPMDFFSWHIYCAEPAKMTARAERIRRMLDENGYEKAESICNEWNYIRNWTSDFVYSLEVIASMKGAAFLGACMTASQYAPVDMLMYYDARINTMFNGLFDPRTLRYLKGGHVLMQFSHLYQLGTAVECRVEGDNIYAVAAKNSAGKQACMVVCYSEDDTIGDHTVTLNLGDGQWAVCRVDEEHSGEAVEILNGKASLEMGRNSTILLKRQ